MSESNATHKYLNRKMARTAAEKAGLDLDDLHVYPANREDGKTMWGWSVLEESSANELGETSEVEPVADEDEPEASGVDFTDADPEAVADQPVSVDFTAADEPTVEVPAGACGTTTLEDGSVVQTGIVALSGMVVLEVEGAIPLAGSGRVARIIAARTGMPVTLRIVGGGVLAEVPAPTRSWSYTDAAGKERSPSDDQAMFIVMCSEPNGATSAQLKAEIQGNTDKVTKNWLTMGESVEKFGYRFDFEYRKIGKRDSEKVYRLYPADVADAAD